MEQEKGAIKQKSVTGCLVSMSW